MVKSKMAGRVTSYILHRIKVITIVIIHVGVSINVIVIVIVNIVVVVLNDLHTLSVRLHSGRHIYSVTKQTIARHTQAYHACANGTCAKREHQQAGNVT